jgi:glutamyl-tRNA synthetase
MIKNILKSFGFNKSIRTRFAPSPTGLFHIGSARTALFNYLFAKKNKGILVLRIEDTDKERSKKEFEEDIINSLRLLGIKWDEEYKQRDRTDIYRKYLEKLLVEDKAYYCFCTQDELEAKRQEQMSRGEAPKYDGKCSKLSKEDIERKLANKEKYIIRFRVSGEKISFQDKVRGKIDFDTSLIGDIAIAKSLDLPLYNFSVVVDDYEMKITHIIRGEDLLPNTPKQILLQKALGFSKIEYAHLPLILGPDKSKLSKRHGAVSVREYLDQGYLPESIINFIAFLGWNPGTNKEIFSLNSLTKEFSLEKIQKSGAIFNIKKLDYINGFYIRQKSLDEITELCIPYLIKDDLISPIIKSEQIPPSYGGSNISYDYKISKTGESINFNKLKDIVELYRERLKILSEVSDLVDFFFKDKLEYDKELTLWKKMTKAELKVSIDNMINILSKIDNWNRKTLEKILMSEAEKIGDKGKLLWPMRYILSAKKASASPFEIADVLGKEKTLKRLKEYEI